MFKNYLLIALRNIKKYKVFSAINILGLAVSMSLCLVVILFINQQKSYDRFHQQANRIYRVITNYKFKSIGRIGKLATSPAPLGAILQREFAGIAATVRLRKGFEGAACYQDRCFEISGLYAEPSFFRLFNFSLASGDQQKALSTPFSVVISKATAQKFFPQEDPIGKVLSVNGLGDFVITGVLEKSSQPSHLKFEVLASFATALALEAQGKLAKSLDDWNEVFSHYNYFLLAKGVSAAALQAKLPALTKKFYPNAASNDYAFQLQALTDINLGPELSNEIGATTPVEFVYILSLLATIIMLAACFNYVNLSVARSLKRAKEVGLRKVTGASRSQLIIQFLSEAVLVAFCALMLACLLLDWLVPAFNSFQFVATIGAQIAVDPAQAFNLVLLFAVFTIFVGLLAGSYPAFYLASLSPVNVLKGVSKIRGLAGLNLRKTLIVIQFALALICIVTITLMNRQFALMLSANYGFNKEHLIDIELKGVPFEPFRNALARHPNILAISGASTIPVAGSNTNATFRKKFDRMHPVAYQFYEVQLKEAYALMRDIMAIISAMAGLAIFIACLGLLGMVIYNRETQIKEIGIRKVLGASVANIVVLLSKDFIKLVLIAVVLATPLAWLLNRMLLQDFTQRIEIEWPSFALAILLTSGLALITIASQTVKAAWTNPVETLRED